MATWLKSFRERLLSWICLGIWAVTSPAASPGAEPSLEAQAPTEPISLSIAIRFSGVSVLWDNSQADIGFIVETQSRLNGPATNWVQAPASVWPIRSDFWNDPRKADQRAEFYRLVAVPGVAVRGRLLDSVEMTPLSIAEVEKLFQSVLGEVPFQLPVKYGVRLHRLVYETVNPFGLRTTASGLLVVPDGATNALPLASYQHGTILSKEEVPSALQGVERVIGIALGTSGYVATLPDYLGLGESPGLHPFVHAKSEATATVDMLRAARTFCSENSIALNGQLFLVGYSEGGHATMATHREIEAFHADEFSITASAPMAGPYDLSGATVEDFLSDRAMPNPYYFLYVLAAYQSIYGFAESLASILQPPYDQILPPLLDGRHEGGELNRAIGNSHPMAILRPEFLAEFRNDPNHPLRMALRENDLVDWRPLAPMRLYHCGGDQDVIFANSQVAYDRFQALGAKQVELINPLPLADHGTCAPFALLLAKMLWFDSLVAP